jgi:hypothetical protein
MTEPCIRSGRQVIAHKEEETVLVMKLIHSRWSDAILYTVPPWQGPMVSRGVLFNRPEVVINKRPQPELG